MSSHGRRLDLGRREHGRFRTRTKPRTLPSRDREFLSAAFRTVTAARASSPPIPTTTGRLLSSTRSWRTRAERTLPLTHRLRTVGDRERPLHPNPNDALEQ